MRTLIVLFTCFALALTGCRGGMERPVPVEGKVTLGGKPVDGAVVTFHSKGGGLSASGKTDAEGNFKLTTINTNDGAPPGEFTVTIAKQETKSGGGGVDISSGEYGEAYGQAMMAAGTNTMNKYMKDVLPSKYADPGQSGLVRTVVKGEENNFTFEL